MTTPHRGGHYNRKCTPSPTSDGFKTPQNPKANPKTLATRCASEPVKAKKKLANTPRYGKYLFFSWNQFHKIALTKSAVCLHFYRTSPNSFAGPKCLEPPMPTSLPRPPTTWTTSNNSFKQPEKRFYPVTQTLSFEDLVQSQTDLDPLSQQLRMLLKVQAW